MVTTGNGAQAPPAARAVGATKIYGQGDNEVRAIDGIDVEFATGAFTAIMGPSGSGKSTLMQCMAGLDRLTSGQTWIGDVELTGLSEKQITTVRRDRVGFIFQAFNLVPTLTALENIRLPLDIAGRDPDGDWMDQVVDALNLRRPAEAPALRALRRAAAARRGRPGPVSRPDIVFADEPTGQLDSQSSAELLDVHAPRRRRVRPDHRHGHARAGRGEPAPTGCCSSATGASWARWTTPRRSRSSTA